MEILAIGRLRLRKQLLSIIACLIFGLAAQQVLGSSGAEQLNTETETPLDFEDSDDTEMVFDEGSEGELSMEDDTAEENAEASLLSEIMDPARFTVRHELSYKTEKPTGIQSNRSSFRIEYSRFFLDHFYIQFDAKLSAFWENDHRAEAEDDDILFETSSREAFLQVSFAETSIKAGYQVMIWGESDGGAITDVISPRDYSELFFISLEESRIGQRMLAIDQFSSIGQWTLFYIPDAEFNEYPEPGTAYYIDPFAGQAVFQDEDPNQDLSEYGLRWKKTFGKSDISVMGASLIENDAAFRLEGFTTGGKFLFTRLRQRYTMTGTAFNYVTGSLLFKGEIGLKSPRSFNDASFQVVEKDVLDTALGLEYSTGGTWSFGMEVVNSHVSGWSDEIQGVPEDASSLVVVWDQTFLNEDLSVNWMTQVTTPYSAYIHSLRTTYKWDDDITLYLDGFYLDVKDEESDLWDYRDQKQIVAKAQYQF